MPRARERQSAVATPHKNPIKIPLNDDRQEKANRLHSRQALHEAQINHIRAAATPVRRRQSIIGGTVQTPENRENDGMPAVGGNAVTPMKRVPILANFEEWMKMATDNKINAANSWNFALIDYFHDMSLLKEGDGVNFQRASCTLDGCVKIYTSRVDSVATETGKLLSGLADGGNRKRKGGEEGEADGADGEEEEEGEEGAKKKKKRAQRSSEATLATSFAQLQLKKMELEFSVDPLFKKASADFDEGGAKGLLLNHLAIDSKGRIVFDSSDDAQDAAAEDRTDSSAVEATETDQTAADEGAENENCEIDISTLAAKFFPDLARLDEQDICPSLKNFDLGDANGSLDLPFLKAPEDWRQEQKKDDEDDGNRSGIFLDEDNAMGFDDDDGDGLGGFGLVADAGFGEGGEAWAKEAALEPQRRIPVVALGGDEDEGQDGAGEVGAFETGNNQYGVTLTQGKADDHENILDYFDQALQKNWAGPEHWRIRRIKDIAKASSAGPTKRKEKEPFAIDFAAPMSQTLADALYTPAASNSTISLPKAQWKSRTRNLLPDDKHFNSRQLLRLFLKPKARMGSRKSGQANQTASNRIDEVPEGEMDEAFWAKKEDPAASVEEEAPQGNYDADFFQDDGLGPPGGGMNDDDDVFADAREQFSPALDGMEGVPAAMDGILTSSQEGAFGAQLVTQSRRLRPEYVQYARVAKKVDVRRLKEELWRGTGFENAIPAPAPSKAPSVPVMKTQDGSLRFTDLMNSLQAVYPKQAMADISTSYCFICVLHLANEKGLTIENQPDFQELMIRRDLTAEITGEGD
ncbi:hypothetical protein W97_04161 [Coniosporium apollinis CBS 100218]|uniref:Condensin complex subunit 2 n=1 Tax=Coniosporium apollinis (strain CBS 100218) TaxID=1168221 RepID=R7YSL9_CONA1|nr:uncharacterized protein W97_04161 [Coniosporium apollinis CBS 100218]EON64927.1 hypothetical protein W97_04161 [Coniosporium apollinis CBS 100218]